MKDDNVIKFPKKIKKCGASDFSELLNRYGVTEKEFKNELTSFAVWMYKHEIKDVHILFTDGAKSIVTVDGCAL